MGLDVPDLDDTDYEELVEEARQLLPAYSEEWTNYNPQDPGITILELLAWLSDSYVYQLDAVTDAHRRKYLQLLGTRPRPPEPAAARLSLDPPDGEALVVPEGTRLTVVDGSGAEKTFETGMSLPLTDAHIETVVSDTGGAPTDQSHANETAGMYYHPFGQRPGAGDAVAFGVEGDPLAGGEAIVLDVELHDDDLPEPGTHGSEEPAFEPSVEVVWEYCTDYRDPAGSWKPFRVGRDETTDLYRGGSVTLQEPEWWSPTAWGVHSEGLFGEDPGLVWLRCRLAEPGYEFPPRFQAVRLGVVPASNRRTVTDEPLQRRRGHDEGPRHSDQQYRFAHAPVVEAAITVDGEAWTRVPDFDASGPTDTHYVLEESAGVVRFGDGRRGAAPDPNARVIATRYVAVDGDDGNVPPGGVWNVAEGEAAADGRPLEDVTVTPLGGASGGADAESLDAAFRRVRREMKTPYRAVSADDMGAIARLTPGLRVARSTVRLREREGGHPDAPPEARVIVVPWAPATVPAPTPSRGFLEAVQDHLDRHRLLTDRVVAVEPTYVGVDVELEVRSTAWRPAPDDEADVAAAIQAYLHPVHGYDGDGWPFGRTLPAEDLADVVGRIEWVDDVDALTITAPGNARVDPDGNVRIDETALFTLGELEVDITAASRPGTGGDGNGGR